MFPEKARRTKVWLGYALALVSVLFVARYLGVNLAAFMEGMQGVHASAAFLAGSFFLAHVAANAVSFSFLNRAGGISVPARALCRAWTVSLFAKYVPGGVWHVVGRGLLLDKLGVPVRFSAFIGIVEQAISLSICLIAVAIFFFVGDGRGPLGLACALLGFVGVLAVGGIAMRRVVGFLSWRPWVQAVLGYSLAMIPYVSGYLLLVRPSEAVEFIRVLFLGTLAGVLALPVPGGIGVREAGVTLLGSAGEAGALMGAMVFARLLILCAEAAAGGIGLMLRQEGKDRQ